jgi:hypothetical protein
MKKILILLGLVLIAFVFITCDSEEDQIKETLPERAVKIINKGSNWYQFNLDGRTFLYHKSFCYNGYECITQIN